MALLLWRIGRSQANYVRHPAPSKVLNMRNLFNQGILAIDAGTTGVTALVVSTAGQIVAQGYSEFPQHFPADGQVEHDLGEIWSATLTADLA